MLTDLRINCSYTVKDANITSNTIAQDGIMWFLLFAVPVIAILGIIGNIFSFVILKESALKNVSHLYLVCLAVFDSITLITILYSFYARIVLYPILLQMNIYSPLLYSLFNAFISCPFRTYTTFTMRLISIWTIVLFSIDRFIAMTLPLQSRKISTIRNTIIVICLLVVTSFFVNIPWIFSFSKVYDRCYKIMVCKPNKVITILAIVEFVFLTLIPSIIICICNITIVCILRNRQSHTTLASKKEAMNQEKMITIRLLLISTAFLFLTLPSLVIVLIHTENKLRNDHSYLKGPKADALHIGLFLFTVNLSINFILYCLTGTNFRRAAWSILCCKYRDLIFYRKVIIDPNLATDSNLTELTDQSGRKNSNSSEKHRIVFVKSALFAGDRMNAQNDNITKVPSDTSSLRPLLNTGNK